MRKRFFLGLIPFLFCILALWKTAPAQTTLASSEGILRLHVIAASDSEEDQSAKLRVRDAILPLFSKAESYEDARAFLLTHGREIQTTAEATLRACGCDDGVQLSLGTETWCVLFPPLCIVSDTGEPIDLNTIEPESVLWNWLKSLF